MEYTNLKDLYNALFIDVKKRNFKDPLVYGDGNPNTRILMIGEAPGKDEVLQGRPFVGKAGKNLDIFIEKTGLKREDLFITNVVKYRPYKVSELGTVSNRTPTKRECDFFAPYLFNEIEIVHPEIIVTLGNTPLKTLLGDNMSIGFWHGKMTEFRGFRLFPLYHPASIIYNRSLESVYYEDLEKLKNSL